MSESAPFPFNIGSEEPEPFVLDAESIEEAAAQVPLSVSAYQPFDTATEQIIAQVSPAKMDNFLKVLNLIVGEKSNDTLVIKDSTITQEMKGAIISADITDIFDKKVNIQIINPKKYTRLFKSFKNNNDVFIINDEENSRFIINNGEVKLFLPKQAASLTEATTMPDFSAATPVCSIKVDKSTLGVITSLAKDVDYIEYLIQDDSLKALHVPDTAIYLFPNYANDPKASKLDETNADLSLRSTVFFPFTNVEEYSITVAKLANGDYFSYSQINTGFIEINIFETLDLTTGGNLLM